MRIGITGGTGSLGSALIAELVRRRLGPIVTITRDELKSHLLNQQYGGLAGEVRVHTVPAGVSDAQRLGDVFRGCDVLIHAAALKRVDQFTYGSAESMLQANVLGTRHVLRMALEVGIRKVLVISSDKASAPINVYGVSKALVEALAVEFNAYSIPRGMAVAVARWGNCMGSRGSVLHQWRAQAAAGQALTLTDSRMTRFWLSLAEAVTYTLEWLDVLRGGEIFVPQLPSAKLVDIAAAVAPGAALVVTGRRAGGEKLHEQLLNEEEPMRTVARSGQRPYYLVTPSVRAWSVSPYPGTPIPAELVYRSDLNPNWLGPEAIAALVLEPPAQ